MHTTVLGTDSQLVIQALGNQKLHVGQYILDTIHKSLVSHETRPTDLLIGKNPGG
jgi:hypothetical protein